MHRLRGSHVCDPSSTPDKEIARSGLSTRTLPLYVVLSACVCVALLLSSCLSVSVALSFIYRPLHQSLHLCVSLSVSGAPFHSLSICPQSAANTPHLPPRTGSTDSTPGSASRASASSQTSGPTPALLSRTTTTCVPQIHYCFGPDPCEVTIASHWPPGSLFCTAVPHNDGARDPSGLPSTTIHG